MSDYIKREDAITLIGQRVNNPAIVNWLSGIIVAVPAADIAPVRHGKWVVDEKHNYEPYCSDCDYEPIAAEKTSYCPNCGAKMDL